MYDENETTEPKETETDKHMETTPPEAKPADEQLTKPAPELAGLTTEDDAEATTHQEEDDDPESHAGDEVDVELPETQ